MRTFVVAASPSGRERVRRLLEEAGATVLGEGGSLSPAAVAKDVDVIVVADGSLLVQWAPADGDAAVAVVALAADSRAAFSLAGMDLRGWAVLPPDASGQEIQAAGLLAAAGLVVVPPDVLRPPLRGATGEDAVEGEALTAREQEVLEHLADGLSNREIADALRISEHTAKFHVASVLGKLGAVNRTGAVRHGLRRGLLRI